SLFVSCSKEENNEGNKEEPSYLVSSNVKYAFGEANVEAAFSMPGVEEAVKNGIVTYKIEYKTKYNNEDIIASGTLTLPDAQGSYPLALIERGTILSNGDAPSEGTMPKYEALAGMGYIVFVPDMIGYGSSKDVLHPYFDYEYTATASVDMYYAVNEYLDSKENATTTANDKFFITGYSQGGYSAMATYKYIEENNDDINVTAVGPGAGGYNVMSIVDNVLKEDVYPATILLAMPMVTYNELYAKRPLSDLFNAPYDAQIQEVIDGEKEWADIAYSLPTVIKELFKPELVDKLKNGESTFLTQAIIDNSVHDWAPSKPLVMYHYRPDEIIPIETTRSTLETMQSNGAVNVGCFEIPQELVTSENQWGAHGAAGFPAILLAFNQFGQY
ncbi:MAG: lipase family protein, partial [Bacteroidota bacterium]